MDAQFSSRFPRLQIQRYTYASVRTRALARSHTHTHVHGEVYIYVNMFPLVEPRMEKGRCTVSPNS